MLSLLWPQIQSLVGELRSCKPDGTDKNKDKKTPNSEVTIHSYSQEPFFRMYYVLGSILEPSPRGYKEDFNTLKDRDVQIHN